MRKSAFIALAAVLVVSACAQSISQQSTTPAESMSMSPSAASTPPVMAGEQCFLRAEVREGLSCIRSRNGLRWQTPYAFQEQACDPSSPILKKLRVVLPTTKLMEARVAAACVAIRWWDNRDQTLPKVQAIGAKPLPEAAIRDVQEQGKAGLQLFWDFRGAESMQPAHFAFESPAEYCKLAEQYVSTDRHLFQLQRGFSTTPSDKPWIPDCSDTKLFTGEWCDAGPAGGISIGFSRDGVTAGSFTAGCNFQAGIRLSLHKFWQAIGSISGGQPDSFTSALFNTDSMLVLYPGLLWESQLYGTEANLCGPKASLYLCSHSKWKGKLAAYRSSSEWWQDGTLDNDTAATYGWARQTASEWFTAHFGLEATFNLAHALYGVSTHEEYLRVLNSYTDMTADELFAGIDAWVAPQFGLTPP